MTAVMDFVTTYCGRSISELNRDELIEALSLAAQQLDEAHERFRRFSETVQAIREGK